MDGAGKCRMGVPGRRWVCWGVGKELTARLHSFPLPCGPVPGVHPWRLHCFARGSRSGQKYQRIKAHLSHPSGRSQQWLWEQVGQYPPAPLPFRWDSRVPVATCSGSHGGVACWLLCRPLADLSILSCCPGTLSRVWQGGAGRGGAQGRLEVGVGWRGGVQVLAPVTGTWGTIHRDRKLPSQTALKPGTRNRVCPVRRRGRGARGRLLEGSWERLCPP